MASDHSSDIIDQYIIDPHFFANKFCHVFRIIDTVAVSDHNDIVIPSFGLFYSHINNLIQRFLSSSLFSDYLELSVVVHMYDGLDLYKCPEHGCCLGHASAPVKMVQVIHCYIMADMQLIFLNPLCQFIDAHAFLFLLERLIKQERFAKTCTKCIDHNDFCLRIFFL